ncbi:MAG: PEP/pyruvate-binding domain-containing protein [Pseudomonadota bacterium]
MTLISFLQHWTTRAFAPDRLPHIKYQAFKELLRYDKRSLELISDLEDLRYSGTMVDWAVVTRLVTALTWSVGSLTRALISMHPGAYRELEKRFYHLENRLAETLPVFDENCSPPYSISLLEAAESPELAGGKAHTLGQIFKNTDLPQPRGFVITTRAFNLFLTHNDLRHRLDELLAEVRLDNTRNRLQELSEEMRAMLRKAEVPDVLIHAVRQRLAELHLLNSAGPWALRSSAVGEDGVHSFAGQYSSILQVADEDIAESYKEVIAGKYTSHAIAYRVRCGMADQELPMAVIVMEMIEPRICGVIYTRDMTRGPTRSDHLAIYAVAGLGQSLVEGIAEPEIHRFSRNPSAILADPAVFTTEGSVSSGNTHLSPATGVLLAGWGMRLEQLFGCPQDIEWCEDIRGICYILQSRSMQAPRSDRTVHPGKSPVPSFNQPVLLSGGTTASSGLGSGRVFILGNETRLTDVPDGVVLVLAALSPTLAEIIERLRAVVAEVGSRASHFASVAREAGLPVLVGMHGARKKLTPGSQVTVDTDRGAVYSGITCRKDTEVRVDTTRQTPFTTRLAALMELVAPLHLLDPASPEFAPQYCASLHDLVRFAHEKGMAEMFSLVSPSGRELTRAQQLVGDLPFTMYILDLGGGIGPGASKGKVVDPKAITSPLMRACWQGLSDPQVTWQRGLPYLDWQQADRLSGGIMSLKSAALGSYAVVAREYLHLVLRFGYHFAVLDSFGGEDPEANYISFRFKGGGGSYENRLLRIRLIEELLSWAGFSVKTRGDLLDAGFTRRPLPGIIRRLTMLGILQGKCRLLDMALTDARQVKEMTQSFKEILQCYVDPE